MVYWEPPTWREVLAYAVGIGISWGAIYLFR